MSAGNVMLKERCEADIHRYRISQIIRRTLIFLFEFSEKNNDECILILVIYWKKTGLVHTKLATIILFIHHRNPENHCHCQ